MTDEQDIEVEVVDDAEAESFGVPAVADDAPADDADAAGADDAPVEDVSAETPQEKYARLLSEGVKRSRLIAITNSRGELIDVQVQ